MSGPISQPFGLLGLSFVLVTWAACTAEAQIMAPRDVAKYLSERGVLVLEGEMAAVGVEAAGTLRAKPSLASDLKSAGAAIKRELHSGVVVLDMPSMTRPSVKDVLRAKGVSMAPVLRSKSSPLRVVPLPRVVFQMAVDADVSVVETILAGFGVLKPELIRDHKFGANAVDTTDPWASLRAAAALAAQPGVEWAVPDCVREVRRYFLPNDVTGLWHWNNTNAAPHTNSVAAPSAWDTTLGSTGVVIAVIDDGLDLTHPDIAPNVWINPLEIAGDGIDNDTNGYVDDINGWDFYNNTNAVAHDDPVEAHGTATAGLAAGRGNNGIGITGGCPMCRVLPIKIFDGEFFVTDSQWADAVAYAQRYARVISIAIGSSDALSNQLVVAFNQASTSALIFASSGNEADLSVFQVDCAPNVEFFGWINYSQSVVGAGSHTFRWQYEKDTSVSRAGDCAWIDAVELPNGTRYDFENGLMPMAWTTGGNQAWYMSSETTDSMVVGRFSARTKDSLGDNGVSWIQASATGQGYVSFFYQVFGEIDCVKEKGPFFFDLLSFAVDGQTNFFDSSESPAAWGLDFTTVNFPAALTSVVAVGASTIDGTRATYSCFGTNLELVAPSGGSTWEDPIRTTDRQGADGYSTTSDYFEAFNGTSASAPIAAGLAGLLFSANTHLKPAEVRQLLRQSARKIGSVAYNGNGFNTRYGYGQVDGRASMKLMLSNMPPEVISMERSNNQVRLSSLGVESGRTYSVYGATTVNVAGAWNWQILSPTSVVGSPVFGVNVTPFFDASTTTSRLFRIRK